MSSTGNHHEPGGILGNYRLIRSIGAGGMGQVYLAEHMLLGRLAAVKVLHAELSREQEPLARFFNEARASAALRHPGLIEVYDFGQDERAGAFIVMELLEGMGLRELLAREKRLPETLAIGVARQVAEAMASAHAHGIVHRDLKPENLFLVPESQLPLGWRVKVLDFGIAKLFGGDLRSGPTTRTGYLLGTPTYMAPEQCHGAAEVDGRADVYALGCILLEMLTGRPPFLHEGVGALIAAHMYDAPPVPSQLVPMLSPALDALVARMLSKSPDERVASMAEAASLLAGLPLADPSALSESIGWSTTLAMGSGPCDLPVIAPTPAPAPAPLQAVRLHAPGITPARAGARRGRVGRARRRRAWFDVLVVLMGLSALGGAGWFELEQREAAASAAEGDAAAPASPPEPEPVQLASLADAPIAAPIAEAPAPEATSATETSAPAAETPAEAAPPAETPAEAPPLPLYVQLRIESRPSGARVTRVRDGAELGRTPLTLDLHRQDDRLTFAIAKSHHHTTVVELPLDRDASAIVELAPRRRGRDASPRRTSEKARVAAPAHAPGPPAEPDVRAASELVPRVSTPATPTPRVEEEPVPAAPPAREPPPATPPIDDGALDPYGE